MRGFANYSHKNLGFWEGNYGKIDLFFQFLQKNEKNPYFLA